MVGVVDTVDGGRRRRRHAAERGGVGRSQRRIRSVTDAEKVKEVTRHGSTRMGRERLLQGARRLLRRRREGNQERRAQAARREPSRPQSGQSAGRGEVQGRRRGQGRPARPGQAQGVRRDSSAVRRRWLRSPVQGGGGGGGGGGGRRLRWLRRRRGGVQSQRPVRRGRPRGRREHRRPVRRPVRARRSAPAQPAPPRQGFRDRDRSRLPGGHQGCGHAAAADQSRAVHELSWQRGTPGHQPEGVRRRATARA